MISIDTNILLRYALDDHASLSPRARDLMAHNDCHVSLLALAETGYVLTSLYAVTKAELLALVERLLALPGLHFEHERRVESVLAAVASGLDWFDAMLWVAAPPAQPLLTFDKRFARKAAALPMTPAVESAIEAA